MSKNKISFFLFFLFFFVCFFPVSGSFADSLRESLKTAAIDEVVAMGAGEIGDEFASGSMAGGPGSAAYWLHKGSHAALGCATASAKGGDCASGAVGGVAAEIVAEQYAKSAFQSGIHSENGLDVDAFNSQVKLVGKYAALAGAALTGKDAQTAVDAGANAVDNNLCGTGLCIAAGFAIVKGVALGVAWVGTELAQETAKAVTGEENVISDAKLSKAQRAVAEEALLQAGGMFIGQGLVSIGGRILSKTQALRKLAPKGAKLKNLNKKAQTVKKSAASERATVNRTKGLETRGVKSALGERTIQGQVDAATQTVNPTVQRGGQDLFRLRSNGHGQSGATVTPQNVFRTNPNTGKRFGPQRGPDRPVTPRDIRELYKAQTGQGTSTIRTRGGR